MNDFIKEWQSEHGLSPDGIIGKDTLSKIKEVYNIPTKAATAHFVGNIYAETLGFTVFEENLNYSAQGLLDVFPKYFKTLSQAQTVAHKPVQIANIVYGGRMGNVETGDGYKFRGRGALQTTGKDNYRELQDYLGVDLLDNPDLVATKYALESAAFYFKNNNLWSKAYTVTDKSIKTVREAVNGGTNGLEIVSKKVKYYYSILAP